MLGNYTFGLLPPYFRLSLLQTNQYFPNHSLKGDLANYRALEIDWGDFAYRLIYRVIESPFPKTVRIISFDEHDPAYDSAKQRLRSSKSQYDRLANS